METNPLTLLTIVAEHILRERLVSEIKRAGAQGFTLMDVEGEGPRHRRTSEVLGGNVKIETIVSHEVADRLLSLLAQDYFPHYAVIAYTTTVHVVRGEKYA